MNNKNVVIDISSITKTKEMMDTNCDELIGMLNKYKTMFEETKNIYDTESAAVYRKLAVAYIDYVLEYINNDLKVYIDNLDKIKKIYIDEINAVAQNINGE